MRTTPALFLALLLLAGCGGASLWPFGEPTANEVSRKPANAVEYRCDEGKAFYVRNLGADAVWLIAPDREIRLDKKADGRFGIGRIELEIGKDGSATLTDPPARFANCKRS